MNSDTRCNVFVLDWNKSDFKEKVEFNSTFCNDLDAYIRFCEYLNNHELPSLKEKGIKKGDIISPLSHEERYRNDWLCIYDGKEIQTLDIDLDDYGHLPSNYLIDEFYPLYFSDIITHNAYIWCNISKEDKKEILQNFRIEHKWADEYSEYGTSKFDNKVIIFIFDKSLNILNTVKEWLERIADIASFEWKDMDSDSNHEKHVEELCISDNTHVIFKSFSKCWKKYFC